MTGEPWPHLAAAERPLWRQLQRGNKNAREKLLELHLGLVRHLARRLQPAGTLHHTADEDLYQSGAIGLLQAIDGFEPQRGVRFATYAAPFILGEMRRSLRSQLPTTTGASLLGLARQIADQQDRLAHRLGRQPTVTEIAQAMKLDVSEIVQAQAAVSHTVPLDENLRAATTPDPAATATGSVYTQELLSLLPYRQQQILRLRHGEGWTQQQTAVALQLSQSQVSRLEKQALKRLRARAWEKT